MSQEPKETMIPHVSLVYSPWDSYTGMEGFDVYQTNASQQQLVRSSRPQAYGSYYESMAFAGMSPFSSFFDGGGANFGG